MLGRCEASRGAACPCKPWVCRRHRIQATAAARAIHAARLAAIAHSPFHARAVGHHHDMPIVLHITKNTSNFLTCIQQEALER